MPVIILTISNLAAKFSRGVVGLFIMYWFGVSVETDSFFIALSMTMFIYTMVSTPLERLVIPFVTEAKDRGHEHLSGFMSSLCTLSVAAFALLLLAMALPLRYYLTEIAMNIDPSVAMKSFFALSLMIVFSSLGAILRGALNALEFFGIPNLSVVVSSVILVAISAALARQIGIYGLAAGFVAGEALSVMFLLALKRFRFPDIVLRPSITVHPEVKELFQKNMHIVIGLFFLWVANMVNVTLASRIQAGGVTIYEYSMRIYYLFAEIYGGFFIYKLVRYSGAPAEKSIRGSEVSAVLASGLVFAALIIVFREPIFGLILRNAGPEALESFFSVIPVFLGASLVYIAGLFMVRWFTAVRRTKVLRDASFFKMLVMVSLSIMLYRSMGLLGIGISVIVSEVFVLVLLLSIYRRIPVRP